MINDQLEYSQDYEKHYVLKRLTHRFQFADLQSAFFNYLGNHLNKKNIIIFESNKEASFNDSPRAIYESLVKSGKKFRLYWRITSDQEAYFKRNKIPYVLNNLTGIYIQARAKYWIINNDFPQFWDRPKGTR